MYSHALICILSIFIMYMVSSTEACTCMPSHPQDQFCRANFVILARVKRQQVLNDTHTRVYKVRIRKEYKMSEKAQIALKSGRLLTADNEAMCGSSLQVGKLYVLAGHVSNLRAHINLCNMATPWQDLSKRQRKGLKRMYRQGCDCKVETCFHNCRKRKDTCVFPWGRSVNDCLAREGICMRSISKQCTWTKNSALATCMKKERPRYHSPFPGGRGRTSGL